MKKLGLLTAACIAMPYLFSAPLDKAETQMLYKADASNTTAVLPLLSAGKTPVIDGEIHPDEWSGALEFTGFLRNNVSGFVPERSGYIYIAANKENIYLAVRSSSPTTDPGGGLRTLAEKHDSDVYNDDSVEMLILDEDGSKVYQIIANNKCAVFDRTIAIPARTGNVKWDCKGLKVASRADSGWWQLEMLIPRASVGSPEKGFKFNVGRNWCFFAPSAMVPTDTNWNVGRMVDLRFAETGSVPVMQMQEIGMPSVGTWNIRHALNDLPAGGSYTLYTEIRRKYRCTDGIVRDPVVFSEKAQFPAPDGKNFCEYKVSFKDPNQRIMRVMLKDNKTGKILFSRWTNGSRGKTGGAVPGTLNFALTHGGENIAEGDVFYYPTLEKAVVELSQVTLPDARKAEIIALPGGSWTELNKTKDGFSGRVTKLAKAGVYNFSLRLTDGKGKKYEFKNVFMLERKIHKWENNQLGKEQIILPPFTPVKINGRTLGTVLREHRINDSGLWDSLIAKDRELLAAPMYYEMVVDGKTVKADARFSKIKMEGKGYGAKYASTLTAGGVRAEIATEMVYDGFFWNRMNIHTNGHKLDRMTLVVPMKEAEAKLLHAQVTHLRRHYYDEVPAGNGVVWDGMKLERPVTMGQEWIIPAVIPYIWLGTEVRGISVFMDSTFGMKVDTKKSACRISRRNGQVVLEMDFINRPAEIDASETIEFGMQATPVKPFDKKMRRHTHDHTARTTKGMLNIMSIRSGALGFANNWARNPMNFDYTLYKNITELLKTGGKNREKTEADWKKWWADNDAMFKQLYAPFNSPDLKPVPFYNWRKGVNEHGLALALKVKEPMIFTRYSDPRLVTIMEPETDYFKTEWTANPLIYICCLRSFPVRSNLDFMVWCYNQDMINGQQGIYLDDMFMWPCMNPETNARYDKEGILHNDLGLLELRELVQRLANLQHQHGFSPRMLEIHMSTTLLVPCYSFATALLGWEWKQGEASFGDRFPLNYIRTININSKIGAEMLNLGGIVRVNTPVKEWRTQTKLAALTRSMFARTLPHDMRSKVLFQRPFEEIHKPTQYRVLDIYSAFRYWEDDCDFYPYWEDDGAISGHNFEKGIILSSYRRKGEFLAVIGNTSKADHTLELKCDRKKLGIADDAKLINAETGEVLDGDKVEIPADDFRIFYLGKNPQLFEQPEWGKKLDIDGKFIKKNTRFDAPDQWEKNWTNKKDIGTITITPGKSGNLMRVTCQATSHTPVFSRKFFPAKAGDEIRVTLVAEGKGHFNIALYLVDENGRYLSNVYGKEERAMLNAKEFTATFTLVDPPKKKIQGIRVVINSRNSADITYSQLKAEIKTK